MTGEEQPAEDLEVPVFGTPLEQVSAYLRVAFAEADAHGEPIADHDARTVASLLASLLGPHSELARFAESGEGDPLGLQEECQQISNRDWSAADIKTWAEHFKQYLSSAQAPPPAQPRPPGASATPVGDTNPQIRQGLNEHGAAFSAYLKLSDVDSDRDDLLQSFQNCYVGAYDSMDAIVTDLTAGIISETEQAQWAADGLTMEDLVRAAWDIVNVDGKLYVFSQ